MPSAPQPVIAQQPDLNEPLFVWKSPSHPYKKRDRTFYQTVAALTFLCIVIVFFLHEFFLIGVILSVAFVVYVISSIPPVEIEHKIMPLGVLYGGHLYPWAQLGPFWFEEQHRQKVLVFHNKMQFPGQIRLVVTDVSETKLRQVIGKYLYFLEKPPKTFSDRLSGWLTKTFPLEATR